MMKAKSNTDTVAALRKCARAHTVLSRIITSGGTNSGARSILTTRIGETNAIKNLRMNSVSGGLSVRDQGRREKAREMKKKAQAKINDGLGGI